MLLMQFFTPKSKVNTSFFMCSGLLYCNRNNKINQSSNNSFYLHSQSESVQIWNVNRFRFSYKPEFLKMWPPDHDPGWRTLLWSPAQLTVMSPAPQSLILLLQLLMEWSEACRSGGFFSLSGRCRSEATFAKTLIFWSNPEKTF